MHLWNVASGEPISRTRSAGRVAIYAVTASPNGKVVASASEDGGISVWDATSGELQHTFVGHSGKSKSVAFSPDGQVIARRG